MPTRRTQLRRRKKPVQWQIGSPIPFGLVSEFAEYFPKRRINDVFGQRVILRHPGHVQSFDKDRLVLADDLRREFLNRVSSGIADSGVESGYFMFSFLAIVTALDLARQAALKPLQPLFSFDQWARVFNLLAFAGRGQRLNTYVYTDFCFRFLQWRYIGFDENTYKIASNRILAYCQIQYLSVFRQLAAPRNIERRGLLGQCYLPVSKREGVGGIAGRLMMMA